MKNIRLHSNQPSRASRGGATARAGIVGAALFAAGVLQAGCSSTTATTATMVQAKAADPLVGAPSSLFKGVDFVSGYSNGLSHERGAAMRVEGQCAPPTGASEISKTYYHYDQGIQYLPVDVLRAMRLPDLEHTLNIPLALFTSSNEMLKIPLMLKDERFFDKPERYGLYPDLLNGGDLPLGISESNQPGYVPMAGLNCAACHTSVLKRENRVILIDGGSSLFSINAFVETMVWATILTIVRQDKFDEFYEKYKGYAKERGSGPQGDNAEADTLTKEAFDAGMSDEELADALQLRSVETEEILLEFLRKLVGQFRGFVAKYEKIHGGPGHADVDPVLSQSCGSYPQESALNKRYGMLLYLAQRAVYFVELGMFAPSGKGITPSGLGRSNPWSVTKNMLAAERLKLTKEKRKASPQIVNGHVNTPTIWDFDRAEGIFWAGVTNSMVERNLAQGVALVTDFNWGTNDTTVSLRRMDCLMKSAKKIRPPLWPVKTLGAIDQSKAEAGEKIFNKECVGCHQDPTGGAAQAPAGSVKYNYKNVGTDRTYFDAQASDFDGKDLFKDVLAPWLSEIKNRGYKREGIAEEEKGTFEEGRRNIFWRKPTDNQIQAMPLYGIWASAPYLHNGSVPSIRELLKPPTERIERFIVGNLEYDPVNLGFEHGKPAHDYVNDFDTTLPGNSKLGHDFGTSLSAEDKDKLIEFLKAYQPGGLKWDDQN